MNDRNDKGIGYFSVIVSENTRMFVKKQAKETCQDGRLANASQLGGEHRGKHSLCCRSPLFYALQ